MTFEPSEMDKETSDNPACLENRGERIQSSMRPHCRQTDACRAKTVGKHCPACSLSAKWKEPGFAAKRAEAFRAKFQNDPEFRARHVEANKARMEEWRARPDTRVGQHDNSLANLAKANTPAVIAKRIEIVRDRAYAGIPADRRDEVRQLARQMPAAEAKRIIRETIPGTPEYGLREVASNALVMRLKHEREKAQRY